MATQYHNPSLPTNLYSSGAVKFDNRQLNQMLYAEQKQREAQRAAEAKALQDEFANNVSKMRDADVADYTNLYGQYKEMKKALLFDKKLQKDPQAYQQAQMITARTYGQLNQLAKASQTAFQDEEDFRKDYLKNGDHYKPDFYQRMQLRRATPLSRLSQVQTGLDGTGKPVMEDLSDLSSFVDNTAYFDLGKALQDSKGKMNPTGYEIRENLDKNGEQVKITPVTYGNSPTQVFSGLLSSFASSPQAAKYARQQGSLITPEMYNDVLEQYKKVDPKKWEQLKRSPESIDLLHPDNQAERLAAYTTMKDFVDSKTGVGESKYIDNKAIKRQMDEAHDLKMEGIRHANREAEIKLRESLNGKSAAAQQLGIDAYLTGLENNAGQEHQIDFLESNGKKVMAKEIPATASFIKSFERLDKYGQKVQPTAVYYANGNYYPIFPVMEIDPKTNAYTGGYKKDANGNAILDKTLSKPIRRADVKVNYSNTILPPKMVAETLEEGDDTMSSGGSGAPLAPKAPSAPKKPQTKGNSGISWH